MIRRESRFKIFFLIFTLVTAIGWTWPSKKTSGPSPLEEITAKYSQLERDHGALQKKYDGLEADRNNILEQTKLLLQEKGKRADLEAAYKQTEKLRKILETQAKRLHEQNGKLKLEKAASAKKFAEAMNSFRQLEVRQKALTAENENLKVTLKKGVENSPQYRKLNTETAQLQNENKRLTGDNTLLDGRLKKAYDTIKKVEERNAKFIQENKESAKLITELRAEKEALTQSNEELTKQVQDAPKRFRDMANENQKMLKETAQMHYNLGVFFSKNRNFDRALKEFKRALDFNPDDPKVHYNLGYLYAEQFDHQEDAMFYFNRFLEIDPKSKEANEVRSYLMVRESLGDKIARH